jgi:hypothetical protein
MRGRGVNYNRCSARVQTTEVSAVTEQTLAVDVDGAGDGLGTEDQRRTAKGKFSSKYFFLYNESEDNTAVSGPLCRTTEF